MDNFAEKLISLMKLENVTNASLAKYLCVDASLISRWKCGVRTPNKNAEYINLIATFFARGAKEEYQRAEIFNMAGAPYFLGADTEQLHEIIKEWLTRNSEQEKRKRLVTMLKSVYDIEEEISFRGNSMELNTGTALAPPIYYTGVPGRRMALENLFVLASESDMPCEMYLFCDESLDWIAEDEHFYDRAKSLFRIIVEKGGILKFIHPYRRGHNKTSSNAEIWLPFFLTGAVEVYNCGKFRDNLFQRTLFVIPGIGAVDSGGLIDTDLNTTFFITDMSAVNSLRTQLDAILGFCQKSMNICRTADALTTTELMADYWEKDGDILFTGNVLQLNTVPYDLLDELLNSTNLSARRKRDIATALRIRMNNFYNSLENNVCIAMLPLHSPEEVAEGKVLFSNIEMILGTKKAYTVEQYARHLSNVLSIMHTNKNYRLQVIDNAWNDVLIMSKIGAGTIVSKLQEPVFTFFSGYDDYPLLTETIFESIEDEYEKIPPVKRTHMYNIKKVSEQLELFEEWMKTHF